MVHNFPHLAQASSFGFIIVNSFLVFFLILPDDDVPFVILIALLPIPNCTPNLVIVIFLLLLVSAAPLQLFKKPDRHFDLVSSRPMLLIT